MANKEVIAKKEAQVKELAENLKNSSLVLVVDYKGTTVADDTALRKSLREANGKATVIKNNIIRRAFEANGIKELDELFVETNALITAESDYLAPLKVVSKFSKEHENYKIKGGVIDGKVMSVDEIKTLASLPSREELLSKLAGALLQTVAKLAVALDQVKTKKESEEGAPAVEAKAEEVAPAVEEAKAEEKAEEPAVAEEAKTEEAAPAAEEVKAEEEAAPAAEETPAE